MADDILYEPDLDEFLQEIHQGGVDENPLRVTVHLYPKRRRALIHWEVLDVPGWEYTYVIGRKYTNEMPKVAKDEDDPANHSKRIEGSSAKKGTKEIKLEPGETLFFGFWANVEQVKIKNKPMGGGPKWRTGRPQWPLAFSITLPEQVDSVERLEERINKEKKKEQLRNILRVLEPKPTLDPKEQAKQEVRRTLLKNEGYLEAADEEVRNFSKYEKQIEEAVEQDLIKPPFGQHLIDKMRGELEKFLEEIERRLTGEPLA